MPRPERASHKRVGIWVRVSTEEQARGESPENHEARARYHAKQKGWIVSTVYHLEGVSGKSVIKHPETLRMLSEVRAGAITGLVFSKIARLARNTRELLEIWDVFEQHNADLISLDEAIDTTTAAGKMMYTVMGTLAEWERREISSRVKASVPTRARLGKSTGGAPPFGYARIDGKLVVNESEAAVVRQMFELFSQHRRKRTVATLLTEGGFRSRRGAKFESRGIRRMLTDPVYKGLRRANYSQQGQLEYFKPPSDWIYYEVPSIVSEELWESCNAILGQQKAPGKRAAKKTAHLFSGQVVCRCGTKMYVRTGRRSYVCLECKNAVGKDELEEVFIEQLKGIVFSPEEIARELESADETLSAKRHLLSVAETEKEAVSSEMLKLYRLYTDDHISGRLFSERNGPLEERYRQLEDQIPRLQAEVDALRLQIRSADQLVSDARDLYTRWPKLDFATRRAIVESVVDRILVDDKEITIELAYLPTSADHPPKDDNNSGQTVGGVLPANPPDRRHHRRWLQPLIRLTPVNRALVSYVLASSGVRFGGYLLACLAHAPSIALEVWAGHAGRHLIHLRSTGKPQLGRDLLIFGGLVVAGLLMTWISQVARRAIEAAAAAEGEGAGAGEAPAPAHRATS